MWWRMPVISALGERRQEHHHHAFEAGLGYILKLLSIKQEVQEKSEGRVEGRGKASREEMSPLLLETPGLGGRALVYS